MPLLSIQTNIALNASRQRELLHSLSSTTAEMLGKPERYVMVCLQTESSMLFAGTDAPLAYVELKSLGLPENRTAEFSTRLCEVIHLEAGISPDRIYLEFSAAERHMWGWDGRTF